MCSRVTCCAASSGWFQVQRAPRARRALALAPPAMRGAGLLRPLALALLAAAAAGGRPSPLEQLAATARIKIRDGRPGVREAKALIAKGAASFGDEFLLRQGMREPRRPLFPLVGCGCETAAVHSRRNADHGVRRGRQLRGRQGPHRQVRRGSGVRGPQCALAPALAQPLRTLTPLCVPAAAEVLLLWPGRRPIPPPIPARARFGITLTPDGSQILKSAGCCFGVAG